MAKQPNQKALTRKHLARLEREQLQQRYLMIGTIVVLIAVAGLILYGILDQTVLKRIRPVAKVGNETITSGEFIDEVRFTRLRSVQQLESLTTNTSMLQYFGSYVLEIGNQLASSTNLGQTVLNNMIEDILIEKEAETRGIVLTDDEIDREVQQQFGYYLNGTLTPTVTSTPYVYSTSTLSPEQIALLVPTSTVTNTPEATQAITETPTIEPATATPDASQTPTPAASPTITLTPTITPTATVYTEQLFQENLNTYLTNASEIDLSKSQLREFIRKQLLRTKVQEAIQAEVKTVDDQVWARHILVATEEEAQLVLDRLKNGESFEALAAEVSLDTSNKDSGGNLEWFVYSQMVKSFSDATFALKVGEISEPVQSDYGYHIIQVLGHEERPLTADQISSAKQVLYDNWLEEAKTAANVETYERWMEIVPTDPEIPASIQQIIDSLAASQQQ